MDWSSDVCSSDLNGPCAHPVGRRGRTSPSRARHGDGAELVGQPSLFKRPVRSRWRRGERHPARSREGGMNADDVIAVAFGRSADGYLAARVEDIAFIALPVKDGLRIATGWRLRKSIDQWTAAAVHGASAAVRSAEHTSELQSLLRISSAVFFLHKQQHHTL